MYIVTFTAYQQRKMVQTPPIFLGLATPLQSFDSVLFTTIIRDFQLHNAGLQNYNSFDTSIYEFCHFTENASSISDGCKLA